MPEAELEGLGIKRYVVDQKPGFPDRIEMVEADVGETVLLLNHVCQPAMTPYLSLIHISEPTRPY